MKLADFHVAGMSELPGIPLGREHENFSQTIGNTYNQIAFSSPQQGREQRNRVPIPRTGAEVCCQCRIWALAGFFLLKTLRQRCVFLVLSWDVQSEHFWLSSRTSSHI